MQQPAASMADFTRVPLRSPCGVSRWSNSYHAEKPFQYQGAVVKRRARAARVSAAKFWLLNRHRAQWSDTSRHELTGANGGEVEISQL
jgi:hypothetical protein